MTATIVNLKEPRTPRTPGTIMKVIELGLESRVYDAMKKPRFSVEALTRRFNDEGIKITAQSIRKFIKKTKKAQAMLISQDLCAAEEYRKLTINYSKAIKDILSEVEDVKNTVKEAKDYAAYNQLIGRLMQGIELIAKLSGDIKPSNAVDIKIIYSEINSDIEKKMHKMKNEIFQGKIIDVDAEIKEADVVAEEVINKKN